MTFRSQRQVSHGEGAAESPTGRGQRDTGWSGGWGIPEEKDHSPSTSPPPPHWLPPSLGTLAGHTAGSGDISGQDAGSRRVSVPFSNARSCAVAVEPGNQGSQKVSGHGRNPDPAPAHGRPVDSPHPPPSLRLGEDPCGRQALSLASAGQPRTEPAPAGRPLCARRWCCSGDSGETATAPSRETDGQTAQGTGRGAPLAAAGPHGRTAPPRAGVGDEGAE